MSIAPGTRTKTKTSGLSEFFGANGHQSLNSARQKPKQLPASPSRISPPQSVQLSEPSSSAKSKKTSIPFWGKRKNPSPSPVKRKPAPSASPPPPVPKPSGSSGTNNGVSSSSTTSPKNPPLPSRLPPINVSPPSLSSKFAAHFTPTPKTPAQAPVKSRGIYGSIHAPSPPISPSSTSYTSLPSPTRSTYRSTPQTPQPASTSAAALISSSTRLSVESHRSSTSTTRPTTITVSISPPEDLYKDDDFTDKFTLPRSAPTPPGTSTPGSTVQKRPPGSHSSTLDNQGGHFDSPSPSPETLSPSPPSSPKMQFPNPPISSASQVSLSPYMQDNDSSKVDLNGGPNDSETSSMLKSRRSMRKHSISVVKALEDALGTPLATDLDSDNESDSNTIPTSTSTSDLGKDLAVDVGLRIPLRQSSLMMSAILQQQPQPQQTEEPPKQPSDSPIPPSPSKVPSIKSSNSSIRSSVSPSKSGPPPTTPLPSPPTRIDSKDSLSSFSSLPTIPSMNSLPSRRSYALLPTGSVVPSRPRARTISTTPVPNLNIRAIPTISSRSVTSSIPSSRRQSKREDITIDDKSNKENKHKPTYEELELTLAELQEQYTTLTAYLKTVSEKLEREKAAAREDAEMWQKEADLWRHEAKSRSAEVKKKDIEIEGLKWLILHPMPPVERSREEQDDDDDASTEAGSLAPSAMFSNDSGSITDADSMRHEASRKRSMTIHDFRSSPQRPRWPKSTTHLQASFSSNNSTTGLGLDYALPDMPYTKWTLESGISSSSSAASSTSSLAVPGLSATNTVSSGLSAIPESPPHRPVDADIDADAQKQRDREERRSSRVLRRVSASSLASSAPKAYVSNIKTGRGPSIEQVLDNAPPNMNEVLEKLRPFGSI